MGYLTVLHVRLGAKIGDLHAKDSNAFCKQQIAKIKIKRASYQVRKSIRHSGLLLPVVYFKLAELASYITDKDVGSNLLTNSRELCRQ